MYLKNDLKKIAAGILLGVSMLSIIGCSKSQIAPDDNLMDKYTYINNTNEILGDLEINTENLTGMWVCEIPGPKQDDSTIACLDFRNDGILYDITAGTAFTKNTYEIDENNNIEYTFTGKRASELTISTPITLYVNSLQANERNTVLNISYSDSEGADKYEFVKVKPGQNDKTQLKTHLYYVNMDYETSENNMGNSSILCFDTNDETVQFISPINKNKYMNNIKNEEFDDQNTGEAVYKYRKDNEYIYVTSLTDDKNIESQYMYIHSN